MLATERKKSEQMMHNIIIFGYKECVYMTKDVQVEKTLTLNSDLQTLCICTHTLQSSRISVSNICAIFMVYNNRVHII